MGNGPRMTGGRLAWPAAKYLSYAFWRAWFLFVASAPAWQGVTAPEGERPGFMLYVVSTSAFVVASLVLSFFHEKTARLLASKTAIVLCGVLGSIAAFVVSFALMYTSEIGVHSAVYLLSCVVTGASTALLAVRAGQVYSSARDVNTAVTCTLLSDVAAGLVFFFFAGTWTEISLVVASSLPLLSAVTGAMGSPAGDADLGSASEDSLREAHRSFARFAVVFLIVGFAAFFLNDLGMSRFAVEDVKSGCVLGVSLLIIVSFGIAVLYGVFEKLSFERLFRPIVVFLMVFVAVSFGVRAQDALSVAGVLLAYFLFSSYVWCFLSYLGRSRYFTPIQVFGVGRGAYSAGSLVACVLGYALNSGSAQGVGDRIPLMVGCVLVMLLLCVVAIRRSDIEAILSEAKTSREDCSQGDHTPSCFDAAETAEPSAIEEPSRQERADSEGPTVLSTEIPETVRLTPREREVYVLMVIGRDSEYIAESLCVSRNTAKTHMKNIYAKFGVSRRQEFIDAVQDLGKMG